MKLGIHPEQHKIHVVCAGCKNTFDVYSTYPDNTLSLDICAECHPFYTKKQKIIYTKGRVERFKLRYKNMLHDTNSEKTKT